MSSLSRRGLLRQGSLFTLGLLSPTRLLATPQSRSLHYLERRVIKKIAFGSCNHSFSPQNYWDVIGREDPDLWVWLGDNIYADLLTMPERRETYRRLYRDPHYAAFRSQVPIVGVWDDHDYAYNNCDGSFADKEDSKEAVLNFLDIAGDNSVWQRDGIYQSYSFGPQGQKTQVVMLDLRYGMDRARSEWQLMSEAQWSWFEDEVRASRSDLLVIGSSLNVTSNITGFGMEGWHSFGWERKRLYDLLTEVNKPTVLLSGDRHFAEMYELELTGGHKVYEVMSSGLTHSLGLRLPHPSRIGHMVGGKNFGTLEISWDSAGPHVYATHRATQESTVYQGFSLF